MHFRHALKVARWIDGAATAGHLSRNVKRNRQLAERDPIALDLGNIILDTLERHAVFMSYALPARIVPPLFNAHRGGEEYGRHIDGAVRPVPGHSTRIRTDLSCTLFLSEPHEYDGGELIIEECREAQSFKPPAGTLVLYPSGAVHRVAPVTRGERIASFFWAQSMVRRIDQRTLLFELDQSVQQVRLAVPDAPFLVDLTAHYHTLLRMWSEV